MRTGCCSRLGVAVSGLASLVDVICRLVGMCSRARRIMSFLLGKKTYRIMSYLYINTGCGRNSELIINKNNILLKVIDTNFSISQFTMVLNFFLHSFTFCVQCVLGGHHPPQCTGAHELSCA